MHTNNRFLTKDFPQVDRNHHQLTTAPLMTQQNFSSHTHTHTHLTIIIACNCSRHNRIVWPVFAPLPVAAIVIGRCNQMKKQPESSHVLSYKNQHMTLKIWSLAQTFWHFYYIYYTIYIFEGMAATVAKNTL
jgi:hypothetical protein